MQGGLQALSLLQQAGDPIPFGPAGWDWTQWLGLGVYLALFVVFVVLVFLLARPRRDSEVAPPGPGGSERRESPGGSGRP